MHLQRTKKYFSCLRVFGNLLKSRECEIVGRVAQGRSDSLRELGQRRSFWRSKFSTCNLYVQLSDTNTEIFARGLESEVHFRPRCPELGTGLWIGGKRSDVALQVQATRVCLDGVGFSQKPTLAESLGGVDIPHQYSIRVASEQTTR